MLFIAKKSNYGAIQSLASNANVYTFAKNGQFQCAQKLPISLVEAIAPNPENAEHASVTYAPKRNFFNLTSLRVMKILFIMESSKYGNFLACQVKNALLAEGAQITFQYSHVLQVCIQQHSKQRIYMSKKINIFDI